jgi:peptidoglycan/LPS O-acetylase OafA/YrhL
VLALDGLRGVAVLMVVLEHSWLLDPHVPYAGEAGVTVFFTMSGFLITRLLLEEHQQTGRIDFRKFYLRRALRLLPALYLMLAVSLAVWGADAAPTVVVTVLNIANVPAADAGTLLFGPLHHMWSLAVEEQFYLVWPAALAALLLTSLRHRLALVFCIAAIVGYALRWVAFEEMSYKWAYHSTITTTFAMLAGAAVAAGGLRPRPVLGSGLLLVLTFGLWPETEAGAVFATGAAVIATVVLLGATGGWLTWPPLRYVGRISYGWYLWHVPAQELIGGWWGSVVSFGVAVVSFHLLEQPLRRKYRRSVRVGPEDPDVSTATIVTSAGHRVDSTDRPAVAADGA